MSAAVFLALTPAGFRHAIALSKVSPFQVWCGADAISDSDYEVLETVDGSRFIYPLAGEPSAILEGAIETIAEHHPNTTVWVEHVPAH